MKKSKGSFIVMAALAFLMAGTFAAQAEKYIIQKSITAGANWGNGKVYFFKGDKYVRYTASPGLDDDLMGEKADPGYPKPINNETWPGVNWTDIDAIVTMDNGKACFFKGKEYIQYDMNADRADPGYPKPISEQTWPGMIWTDGIDAAVNWGDGKIFFFKGGEYIRYSISKGRADFGYPKRIEARNWPGLVWTDGIDDVVNWGNGKAYFFKGYEYIRYDIKEDRADPGYPKRVSRQTWPGLVNW